MIRKHGRARVAEETVAAAVPEPAIMETLVGMEARAVEDPQLEWKRCAAAIPAALVIALAFHIPFSDAGRTANLFRHADP